MTSPPQQFKLGHNLVLSVLSSFCVLFCLLQNTVRLLRSHLQEFVSRCDELIAFSSPQVQMQVSFELFIFCSISLLVSVPISSEVVQILSRAVPFKLLSVAGCIVAVFVASLIPTTLCVYFRYTAWKSVRTLLSILPGVERIFSKRSPVLVVQHALVSMNYAHDMH